MARVPEQLKTTQELYREMDALKLRIALREIEEKNIDEILREAEQQDPELEQLTAQAQPRMLKMIRRELRKAHALHFVRKTAPKAGKLVASIALCFFLGLSVAVATVKSVRHSVLNFIVNIEERYTSLSLEESGEFVEVPAEWEGRYYPAYIPEGYVLHSVDKVFHEAFYVNNKGGRLTFSENEADTYINIDTEDATISYAQLKGQNALVAEKMGCTTVTWMLDNVYFVIMVDGTKEEALQMAKSVRMIK